MLFILTFVLLFTSEARQVAGWVKAAPWRPPPHGPPSSPLSSRDWCSPPFQQVNINSQECFHTLISRPPVFGESEEFTVYMLKCSSRVAPISAAGLKNADAAASGLRPRADGLGPVLSLHLLILSHPVQWCVGLKKSLPRSALRYYVICNHWQHEVVPHQTQTPKQTLSIFYFGWWNH